MIQHEAISVPDATVEHYRRGGRTAGEQYVAQLIGHQGPVQAALARDALAVHAALDSAARQMEASGASEAKLKAWSDGFVQALGAHTRRDRRLTKMYRAIAADLSERRAGTKRKWEAEQYGNTLHR